MEAKGIEAYLEASVLQLVSGGHSSWDFRVFNSLVYDHAQYFTRRINMYPGPGILPADGRTFYVSLGLKL